MPQAAAYSASKAGLMALAKSVAKEVACEHIFVNCITPAIVRAVDFDAEIADRALRGREIW